jgi:chromosome segregation ATPase
MGETRAVEVPAEVLQMLEGARDAASIEAFLRAKYKNAKADGIDMSPVATDDVVQQVKYVLASYSSKVAAAKDYMTATEGLDAARAKAVEEAEAASKRQIELVAERDALARDLATEKIAAKTAEETLAGQATKLAAALAELDELKAKIDEATDDDPSASDALEQMRSARDHYAAELEKMQKRIDELEAEKTETPDPDPAPASEQLAKVSARAARYKMLVDAVGRKLIECPSSVKAAYGAAIARS